jgi:putative hydrolase of the HAD superfamily
MSGFQAVFFDLDDTLYPPASGVWDAIGERINRFMIEHVGLDPKEVSRIRGEYFLEHGTTLNGLMRFHQVDPIEYMDYVHDLPVEEYLSKNPLLKKQLEQMPQKKIVMTNASSGHALRVLQSLGIEQEIDLIIDLFTLNLMNKPRPEAYRKALDLSNSNLPQRCLFVDDQERNLPPAKALGMTTVLVHTPSTLDEEDYAIPRITELVHVIPGLQVEA